MAPPLLVLRRRPRRRCNRKGSRGASRASPGGLFVSRLRFTLAVGMAAGVCYKREQKTKTTQLTAVLQQPLSRSLSRGKMTEARATGAPAPRAEHATWG